MINLKKIKQMNHLTTRNICSTPRGTRKSRHEERSLLKETDLILMRHERKIKKMDTAVKSSWKAEREAENRFWFEDERLKAHEGRWKKVTPEENEKRA